METTKDSVMIDPKIFEDVQRRVEQDTEVNETVNKMVQQLNRDLSVTQAHLCRIHSTPRARLPALLTQVEESILAERNTLQELAKLASAYPYYKYSQKWSMTVSKVVSTVVLCAWLGGFVPKTEIGRLPTIEEVGRVLGVDVNVKERDAFHITIEEYLIALTDVTEELSRLAVNCATRGEYDIIMKISSFVKELQSGFMILNLKNDGLRRKSDGIKYHVKRVEDVIYDLTLRGLIRPQSLDE